MSCMLVLIRKLVVLLLDVLLVKFYNFIFFQLMFFHFDSALHSCNEMLTVNKHASLICWIDYSFVHCYHQFVTTICSLTTDSLGIQQNPFETYSWKMESIRTKHSADYWIELQSDSAYIKNVSCTCNFFIILFFIYYS